MYKDWIAVHVYGARRGGSTTADVELSEIVTGGGVLLDTVRASSARVERQHDVSTDIYGRDGRTHRFYDTGTFVSADKRQGRKGRHTARKYIRMAHTDTGDANQYLLGSEFRQFDRLEFE